MFLIIPFIIINIKKSIIFKYIINNTSIYVHIYIYLINIYEYKNFIEQSIIVQYIINVNNLNYEKIYIYIF